MRFAILNDLHLGRTGQGRWHNRMMYGHAEEIARAAVVALNAQSLDGVFVLGDITEAGQPTQVALACDVLGGLNAPWYVLPGNHDRAAVRNGLFDQAFAGHVIQPYTNWGNIGAFSIRERIPTRLDDEPDERAGYLVDEAWLVRALTAVRADSPPVLIVLSHFPIIDENLWAEQHNGKDARSVAHGETLLARLADATEDKTSHPRVVLCAHEHWHHVSTSQGWLQCTNAAMVEYPMEMRLVSAETDALRISTMNTPVHDIAQQSLETESWVQGRPQDRDVAVPLTHWRKDHEQA